MLLLNLCNKAKATKMEISSFQNIFSKMHFDYLLYVLEKTDFIFIIIKYELIVISRDYLRKKHISIDHI